MDRTESAYYDFREFDPENARQVLSYYPQFFHTGPVLELACGPGTFLDLLAERDVEARGVDLDPGMVEQAVARGHQVELADALDCLRATPDSSLTGLFAAHFLEHLPAELVQKVYDEAARALCDEGVFVAVVPNAGCMSVLGYDFWRDPTHVRFYDPVALEFFARTAGLAVEKTGGNPLNHPGAPPLLHVGRPDPVTGLSDAIEKVLDSAIEPTAEGRGRAVTLAQENQAVRERVTAAVADVLRSLDDQVQILQHQVHQFRTAYANLLGHLYPSNEVFVVVRKPGADPVPAEPGASAPREPS